MRLVILESPYAGDIERNVAYARECIRDCLLRGESPIASHLLFTDGVPAERELSIAAGLEWVRVADAIVAYIDHGVSNGMARGIGAAVSAGLQVEYRVIYPVAAA